MLPCAGFKATFALWSACEKNLFKLSVRVEVSSVESNETTAATVSCDLAPSPQRRRRRHPSPPPPRNLPFVTLPFYSIDTQTADKHVHIRIERRTRLKALPVPAAMRTAGIAKRYRASVGRRSARISV